MQGDELSVLLRFAMHSSPGFTGQTQHRGVETRKPRKIVSLAMHYGPDGSNLLSCGSQLTIRVNVKMGGMSCRTPDDRRRCQAQMPQEVDTNISKTMRHFPSLPTELVSIRILHMSWEDEENLLIIPSHLWLQALCIPVHAYCALFPIFTTVFPVVFS